MPALVSRIRDSIHPAAGLGVRTVNAKYSLSARCFRKISSRACLASTVRAKTRAPVVSSSSLCTANTRDPSWSPTRSTTVGRWRPGAGTTSIRAGLSTTKRCSSWNRIGTGPELSRAGMVRAESRFRASSSDTTYAADIGHGTEAECIRLALVPEMKQLTVTTGAGADRSGSSDRASPGRSSGVVRRGGHFLR